MTRTASTALLIALILSVYAAGYIGLSRQAKAIEIEGRV